MNENETLSKELKFFSQRSIWIATFIGSPLAAGYLIRKNYLDLNEPDKGRMALFIGIISTIALFIGVFSLPESWIDKMPNQIIPFIYTGIVYLIVEKTQGSILNQHKESGNEFYSGWKAAGVGAISLLILLLGLFLYVYLAPDNEELEKYDATIEVFTQNEAKALVFYDHLETETNAELIQELDNIVIPKWKENIEIIKKASSIKNSPQDLIDQNVILLEYSELRLQQSELFKKALILDTDEYFQELELINEQIDQVLAKLN